MEPIWDYCFICAATKIHSGCSTEPFNPSTHSVLLKYLLGISGKCRSSHNPGCVEGQAIYKGIVKLASYIDDKAEPLSTRAASLKPGMLIRFCVECDKKAEQLVELQNRLDAIQIKIEDTIWSMTSTVISNSRMYGGNVEAREAIQKFERQLSQKDKAKRERKFLDVLHSFQTMVFERKVNDNRKDEVSPNDFLEVNVEPEDDSSVDSDDMEVQIKQEVENDGQISADDDQQPQQTQQVVIVMNAGGGEVRKCVPMEIGDEQGPSNSKQIVKTKLKKHSGKKLFKCKLCSFASKRHCQVEQHLVEHEIGEKTRKCPQCDQCFVQKQAWDRHMSHHMMSRRQCDICREQSSLFYLEKHLKKMHGDRIFRCDFCPFMYGTYFGLINHMWLEKGNEVKCQLCPADKSPTFSSKQFLVKHLYESHEEFTDNSLKCDVPGCTRIFSIPGLKQMHMNFHSKKFPCLLCDKAFQSDGQLQSHIRTKHNEEKLFICDLCGKAYAHLTSLNSHVANHGKKYICDKCPGKEYRLRSSLEAHIQSFHEGKSWKCEICGKEMVHEKTLQLHMKSVHADKKEFECEVCKFATTTKDLLKNHMLQHGGEKKFQCRYCPKAFLVKTTMQIHERIHTGEKPYKCEACGVAYSQRGQLRIHNRNKHPSNGQPQLSVSKVRTRSQKNK